jgi:hypothetical protein
VLSRCWVSAEWVLSESLAKAERKLSEFWVSAEWVLLKKLVESSLQRIPSGKSIVLVVESNWQNNEDDARKSKTEPNERAPCLSCLTEKSRLQSYCHCQNSKKFFRQENHEDHWCGSNTTYPERLQHCERELRQIRKQSKWSTSRIRHWILQCKSTEQTWWANRNDIWDACP